MASDRLHPGDICAIADLVSENLGQSVIPSILPAEVGTWIRDTCKHQQLMHRNNIPMNRGVMNFDYRLNPDGTLILEMQDCNGRTFWRGVFRPEEAK